MQSMKPGRYGMKPLCSLGFRRNLLFVATLSTLILVFLGSVSYHDTLSRNAVWFTIFWAGVFILATAVLALAVDDLRRVRYEHHKRVRELEKELAVAAAEARDLMRQQEDRDRGASDPAVR
jgi:ABC-type siderophore export system fused ATPase/permease subunit